MKALTLFLVLLIALLQYPLWLGKGSWLRVWDLNHKIAEQEHKNAILKARNDTLDAEVRDLKNGKAAIEERARSELGMIKSDEEFYQVIENPVLEAPSLESTVIGSPAVEGSAVQNGLPKSDLSNSEVKATETKPQLVKPKAP